MKYKTIDFFIFAKQANEHDIAKEFSYANHTIKVYQQRLGHNFTEYFANDNKGVEKIQKIDCPFCDKESKAFIASEAYSEDLSRRILSAKCVNCSKSLYMYQEYHLEEELS